MNNPAAELEVFLAPYGKEVTTLFMLARAAVREAAPNVNELIYDAYNTVSSVYSYSDRLKDAFCHVAAYDDHVNLGFNQGAKLTDPYRLLQGDGLLIRHVRVTRAADLKQHGIAQLLKQAVTQGKMLCQDNLHRNQILIKATSSNKRRP